MLNLLAEHIEFAPCTEHNRVTVYDPHLEHFKAFDRMLTCPGMELTGRPLPINHQNAFPLVPRPRTQDGGGPQADVDPVVQIERLAMWDNGSEKLVQINHPNIPQMVGDRDTNGVADGGFEKMFSFMDVIEIHPLDNIFKKPTALPNEREQGNAIFHWLQLHEPGLSHAGRREYRCALEFSRLGLAAQLHQVAGRRSDQGERGRAGAYLRTWQYRDDATGRFWK